MKNVPPSLSEESQAIHPKAEKRQHQNCLPRQAVTPKRLRLPLLVVGMAFSAFGISLIAATALGSTPISTIPLTLTAITGISFGTTTFIVNALFVVIQALLLRRNFRIRNLLQLPSVLVFSVFIDFSVRLLSGFEPASWTSAMSFSVLGTLLLAVGIILQIRSQTVVQPGEGLVLSVSLTFKKPFGDMKVLTDVMHVVTAALIGWAVLGRIVQIREGTLVSAVLVGLFVKLGDKLVDRVIEKRRAAR